MTHIQNIQHILQHGITHRNSPNANPEYISIGDDSIITTRGNKRIWVNNGETFSFEHGQIQIGDFIPFYFGVRMPMLYVIQKGYNGVKKQQAENIVYCVCILKEIVDRGYTFYFTDGHAIDSLSSCYDLTRINNIETIVDFRAVKAKDWTTERDLKRKMEAEILIKEDILPECIVRVLCYNEKAKTRLLEMGVDDIKIRVNAGCYF